MVAATVAAAAHVSADEAAVGQAFVPGEISIGEPIVLPAVPPAVAAPASPTAATAVPGNGWLGVVVAESRTPGRWMVAEVLPDSPAAHAGIRPGDDVRAINGTVLMSADDVAHSLTTIASGQTVSVAIARDETVTEVQMRAVPRPASPPAAHESAPPAAREWQPLPATTMPTPVAPPPPASPSRYEAVAQVPEPELIAAPRAFTPSPSPGGRGRTALGVRTVPIDAGTQSRFRLHAARGAYVIGVVQDLPAARAGVPPGSVIVALDERPVGSPEDLARMVTSGPVGSPVSLEYVLPGGESKKAAVTLQSLDLPMERALVGPQPAASVPTLLPGPGDGPAASPVADPSSYRANRPLDAATVETARGKLRRLRADVEALERLLDVPGGR